MRSLIDNTRKKPYATLNLLSGGCISVRPTLISRVKSKKGYTEIKYGETVLQLKETADKVLKLIEVTKKMEAEAKRVL